MILHKAKSIKIFNFLSCYKKVNGKINIGFLILILDLGKVLRQYHGLSEKLLLEDRNFSVQQGIIESEHVGANRHFL